MSGLNPERERPGIQPGGDSVKRAAWVTLLACLLMSGAGCVKLKTRVLMRNANNLYKSEKYLEAIQKYDQVIKIDPWWTEAYRNAGLAYLALYQPGSLHRKDVEYSDNAILKLRRYLQFVPTDERM